MTLRLLILATALLVLACGGPTARAPDQLPTGEACAVRNEAGRISLWFPVTPEVQTRYWVFRESTKGWVGPVDVPAGGKAVRMAWNESGRAARVDVDVYVTHLPGSDTDAWEALQLEFHQPGPGFPAGYEVSEGNGCTGWIALDTP